MKEWLVGSLKSWSMWLGALMLAFPEWWPLIEPMVRELVSPEHYGQLVRVFGILVVLMRFKTTQSVAEKRVS